MLFAQFVHLGTVRAGNCLEAASCRVASTLPQTTDAHDGPSSVGIIPAVCYNPFLSPGAAPTGAIPTPLGNRGDLLDLRHGGRGAPSDAGGSVDSTLVSDLCETSILPCAFRTCVTFPVDSSSWS
jgi:hypothetical protein